MIWDLLHDVRAWVTVPSAGRPGNVGPQRAAMGIPATWYVPEPEMDTYLEAGAPNVRLGSNKSLTEVRNRALEDAFEMDAVCIQLDDDLVNMHHAVDGKAFRTTGDRALEDMLRRLSLSDFKLAGAAPTNNPYFTRKASSTNLFIIGSLILVKPTHLRFDERIRLKNDYDYTLAHITTYGGVLRCDDWLPTFKHYGNAGGCVSYRDVEMEENDIAILMEKWPGLVRRHPRREHEVLLRAPRHERVVFD